ANAYVRRPLRPLPGKDQASSGAAASGAGAAAGAAGAANPRVVNLLAVSAPQQVQLEVKVAEVSKTLLEKLEAGATVRFGSGSWMGTLLSNFISGTAHGLLDARKSNGNQLTFEAEKQDGIVRVLAEPNIMAISGQEGTFLAGGKFYIPVSQGNNNSVTLEEKEFGVGLRFTPTVLVFVVTAHLVKPLAGNSYLLPTDKVGVPSRAAVMLGGRLEGPAPDQTTGAASAPAAPAAHSAGGFELK